MSAAPVRRFGRGGGRRGRGFTLVELMVAITLGLLLLVALGSLLVSTVGSRSELDKIGAADRQRPAMRCSF